MIHIKLPHGGYIETEGREYAQGAYLHVFDGQNQMVFRAVREEFAERPDKTMEAFLEALSELVPNSSPEEGSFAFDFEACYLVGDKTFAAIVHEASDFFDGSEDEENEIIYYDIQEWADAPEEVIGALLGCLATTIRDFNHPLAG